MSGVFYHFKVTANEYRALRMREHWAASGADSLEAARRCSANGNWGSSVSRSYYAAYSFSASVLAKEGVSFRDDRVGPEHEPLPDLIRDKLKKRFAHQTLKEISVSLTALYKRRVVADYRPHELIDKTSALNSERLATTVHNLMSEGLS